MNVYERLRQTFETEFGAAPDVVARAPGRVNLIGEHTDYNDGFVLPVAIDREIRVALRRRGDRLAHLRAATLGRRTQFPVDDIRQQPRERWSHYARGVALYLQQRGHRLGGFEMVLEGDVPSGAGLSSSAAVEVATGTALQAAFGLAIDPVQLALLCQQVENEFVGVSCGIMDQFISALGRRDHALFLDCRSLEVQHVPLGGVEGPESRVEGGVVTRPSSLVPRPPQIVVADTTVKRGLVDSEYNRRRAECEEAVRRLSEALPGIRALRDVTLAQLEPLADRLPDVVRRRARHVISENERVQASVAALRRGDLAEFGRLMYASHHSLHDDYQVTVPQLDALVEAAREVSGVFGSRMTGAGFGGCTVSLVDSDAVETFQRHVRRQYRAATGLEPRFFICQAVDGASIVQ